MRAYGFDPGWEGERQRMELAESLLDPVTIRHLSALGVAEGWRCLEVGAGAGSVARWMARRAGAAGHVVATDIDTRFVEALVAGGEPGLEVLRHDIAGDEPLPGPFDVAHARLVLQHLPGRARAVEAMVGALAPGGWVLVEELDFTTSGAASAFGARAFARIESAIHRLLSTTGFDPAFGRHLPGLLRSVGCVDVDGRGGLSIVLGGTPYARWYAASVEALRDRLVTAGLATGREVDRVGRLLEDPGFELVTPVLVSARGRRPPGG